MGGPKALLRTPDGRTFLDAVVSAVREAGVSRVVAVVGPWWQAREAPCSVVLNPHPEQGLISSLQIAIRSAFDPSGTPTPSVRPAILLALVDHPAVRAETVRILVEAHRANPERIIVPVFRDGTRIRRGHPVVFPAWAVPEFFGPAASAEGPRAVLRRHPDAVREVEVKDPGVLLDINTPACYEKWAMEASGSGKRGTS